MSTNHMNCHLLKLILFFGAFTHKSALGELAYAQEKTAILFETRPVAVVEAKDSESFPDRSSITPQFGIVAFSTDSKSLLVKAHEVGAAQNTNSSLLDGFSRTYSVDLASNLVRACRCSSVSCKTGIYAKTS
jgi:hypothetical protein